MKALFSKKMTGGWQIIVEFAEKIREGRKMIPITEVIFFSEVTSSDKTTLTGAPIVWDLGMVKDFGQHKISGFVKSFPSMSQVYDGASPAYANQTGRFIEKIRDVMDTDDNGNDKWIKSEGKKNPDGTRTPYEKTYPKTYVMTKDGWTPMLHIGLMAELERNKKKQPELERSRAFNSAMKECKNNAERLKVIKEFTTELPKRTRKERRELKPLSLKKPKTIAKVELKSADRASTFSYDPKPCASDKLGSGRIRTRAQQVLADYRAGKLKDHQISAGRQLGFIPEGE